MSLQDNFRKLYRIEKSEEEVDLEIVRGNTERRGD